MHVVVNAAMSLDGKLATRSREPVPISGEADFDRVDALRSEADVVVVGIGTVLADDPSLTVGDRGRIDGRRAADRPPHPARAVVDSRARTPVDAAVLDGEAASYVLASEAAPQSRIDRLEARGATVVVAGEDRVDLPAAFAALATHGIDRAMVEGGGELLYSVFDVGLADVVSVYVGSVILGGRDAPTLADGVGFDGDFPRLTLESVERIDDGVLLEYTLGEPSVAG